MQLWHIPFLLILILKHSTGHVQQQHKLTTPAVPFIINKNHRSQLVAVVVPSLFSWNGGVEFMIDFIIVIVCHGEIWDRPIGLCGQGNLFVWNCDHCDLIYRKERY